MQIRGEYSWKKCTKSPDEKFRSELLGNITSWRTITVIFLFIPHIYVSVRVHQDKLNIIRGVSSGVEIIN